MASHAAAMDAHHYWGQFTGRVFFDEPKVVIGTLIDYGQLTTKDGDIPKILLQTKEGDRVEIFISQVRLLAAFKEHRPAKGDLIKITYEGESKRAAPGMNKTKEFSVAVRRPGESQSQNGSVDNSGETPASAPSEAGINAK